MTVRSNPSLKTQEFFTQNLENQTQSFFDMPPAPFPTLLETLMKKWMMLIRISSWSTASLVLAFSFYVIFLSLSFWDSTLDRFRENEQWATLMFPVMMVYLLLGATRLRYLLNRTISNLRQQNIGDSCQHIFVKTYYMHRFREWMAVICGIFLYALFGPASNYWSIAPIASIKWQLTTGSLVVGGLFGWHVLNALHATFFTAKIFKEIPKDERQKSFGVIIPILQWSIGVSLFFLGAVVLKLIFLRDLVGHFTHYAFFVVLAAQILLIGQIFIKFLWPHLQTYIKMPTTKNPHILDESMSYWMVLTGIKSWPIACLLISMMVYGGGFFISWNDNTVFDYASGLSWWNKLLFPVMLFYLLMVPVFIRHLSNEVINAIQGSTPTNNTRFKQLVDAVDRLDRGTEWLVFAGGTSCYLLLSITLEHPSYMATVYNTAGRSILLGLTAWHVYAGLVRTKRLGQLHQHVNDLNLFGPHVPIDPIIQWNFGIILSFMGGIILSALFIPDWFHPTTVAAYTALIFAALLVFVFSNVPTGLLSWFRIFRIVVIFTLVAVVGTIGFYYLEHEAQNLTWLDALYMTIITMTTIGYGDETPITESGRLFTIVLSLVAVGISTFAISALASFLVEADLNQILWGRKMTKDIAELKDHIILCGAGRVGLQIAAEFHKTLTPFIIVEKNIKEVEELGRIGELLYIEGDATKDEILLAAGINRAKGLVTTLDDDKDNAFVVLTARALNANPYFRIISRLSDEENREKLHKAGATEIVSPHAIGGLRMASVVLRPSVVNFLDGMLRAEQLTGQTLRIEELRVDEINVPSLIGHDNLSIINVGRHTQLMVIAIQSQDGGYRYKPQGNVPLKPDDVLIVIGTPYELAQARGLA